MALRHTDTVIADLVHQATLLSRVHSGPNSVEGQKQLAHVLVVTAELLPDGDAVRKVISEAAHKHHAERAAVLDAERQKKAAKNLAHVAELDAASKATLKAQEEFESEKHVLMDKLTAKHLAAEKRA